jgi:hypothetical protein
MPRLTLKEILGLLNTIPILVFFFSNTKFYHILLVRIGLQSDQFPSRLPVKILCSFRVRLILLFVTDMSQRGGDLTA